MADAREELQLEEELSASTLAALRQFMQQKEQQQGAIADAKEQRPVQAELPESNAEYKRMEYWDERFGKEEHYEWLLGFEDVHRYLEPFLDPSHTILVVGCGNSSFSADLYDAGFPNIVNIDFSTVVIDSMRQKHEQERPHMRWEVMDMTDLKYESGTFDVVIDKAAMDALMTDEGDVWDPNPEVLEAADRMCGHMSRVLKPHGVFLQISFAQPHFRRRYLLGRVTETNYSKEVAVSEKYGWSLEHQEIVKSEGCMCDFLYICRKQS